MKIAISTDLYWPMINGVAQFSKNLAEGLAQKGHEVLVVAPSQTGEFKIIKENGVKIAFLSSQKLPIYPDMISKVPAEKEVLGFKIPRVFYKNGLRVAFTPYSELKKALDDFQPDIIHNQTPGPVAIAAVTYAKRRKVPLVSTGHAYPDNLTDQVNMPKFIKKPVDAVLRWYFGLFLKKSDYATMPTQIAINDLAPERPKKKPSRISQELDKTLENYPKTEEFLEKLKIHRKYHLKIEALSNGVDLSRFKPGKAPKEIYKKYQIPEDAPIVLYVGRIDREKSLDVLLESFRLVLQKLPAARLVLVGDGKDVERLKSLAENLTIATETLFLGRVVGDDLPKLYKTGTIFAITSETETQSIVLMEALASGLPAVAVNAGAIKELVKNNRNGFLKKPRAIKPIANAIVALLSDPSLRDKFSQEGLKIAKKHDISHTLGRVEEIYVSVLKEKRPSRD
jgi:glycosyltransferase involved in cell wall biosynthesis